jgi:hypothetical protein
LLVLVYTRIKTAQGVYVFFTGAFLYVYYSFLLISNKFCDLILLHWVEGQCGKEKLLHYAPSLSPKAELWAIEAHVNNVHTWTSD